MVLPGEVPFIAVVGMTFDCIFNILEPIAAAGVKWATPLLWNVSTSYVINEGVVGSDGKAYKAKANSTGKNPVGDVSGTWELLPVLNLTGYTGEMKFANVTLTNGSGLTLGGVGGTVAVKVLPSQTVSLLPNNYHYSLVLTDGAGNEYEYCKGAITWMAL